MSRPQSTEEARLHIEQIRHAKGLNGPQSNTEDLEAALTMLVHFYHHLIRLLLNLRIAST